MRSEERSKSEERMSCYCYCYAQFTAIYEMKMKNRRHNDLQHSKFRSAQAEKISNLKNVTFPLHSNFLSSRWFYFWHVDAWMIFRSYQPYLLFPIPNLLPAMMCALSESPLNVIVVIIIVVGTLKLTVMYSSYTSRRPVSSSTTTILWYFIFCRVVSNKSVYVHFTTRTPTSLGHSQKHLCITF